MTLIADGDCDTCGFACSNSEFVSHLIAMLADVTFDCFGVCTSAGAVPQHVANSAQASLTVSGNHTWLAIDFLQRLQNGSKLSARDDVGSLLASLIQCGTQSAAHQSLCSTHQR